jgi:hypothetical protein
MSEIAEAINCGLKTGNETKGSFGNGGWRTEIFARVKETISTPLHGWHSICPPLADSRPMEVAHTPKANLYGPRAFAIRVRVAVRAGKELASPLGEYSES